VKDFEQGARAGLFRPGGKRALRAFSAVDPELWWIRILQFCEAGAERAANEGHYTWNSLQPGRTDGAVNHEDLLKSLSSQNNSLSEVISDMQFPVGD
jgi:hypothetical protein